MHGIIEMGRKKKLRRPHLMVVARHEIHDRRALELSENLETAELVVPDPYEAEGKIVVLRSLRDDPLAALHNSKQIDEAQYIAGRHWQRAYEIAEIGGGKGIDTTRERVDGGQIAQPTISDKQARAFADLYKAQKALGEYGSSIVHDLLARHLSVKQSAERRMMFTQRELDFLGRRFRECLETLAVVFGYAMRNGHGN